MIEEKPFVSLSNTPTNLRLFKLVPRIPVSKIKDGICWHCGKYLLHKLIWCQRCYFYTVNNFNQLEYVEPPRPREIVVDVPE